MTSNLRIVPDSPPRAVLYLRQSTHREESISLELQETAGRDYCARMGYVVTAVEADPGISGRTWVRPAVQRVMDMIERGDADVIVLWRWSRLSRSRKDWAVAADRVDVAGGRIESATEPNDVTAAGRFARGVMTELAAFESERIGEQWKEVHDRRRRNGLPGGGKIPYGWMRDNGTIVPNPDQAPAVQAMYELYLSGSGARQIAKWLQDHGYLTYSGRADWSYNAVTQAMDSPFHAGFIVHKGELLEGAHDGIVDPETWRRYQAVRRERASQRAVKRRYLLSGIATCASCGQPMFGFTVKGDLAHRGSAPYFGYRCRSVSDNPDHGPGTISTRIIDPLVIGWVNELAQKIESEMPTDIDDHAKLDAQRIARDITAIDKQVISLTEGLASGLVPERAYRATVGELEQKRATLSKALQDAEDRITLTPDDPVGLARSLAQDWDLMPLDAKRQGLRSLLHGITIDCRDPRMLTIRPRFAPPVAITL